MHMIYAYINYPCRIGWLSGVGKIVDSLWPILQASDGMAKIFNEKPKIVYRRPRNLRDSLVRARVKMGNIGDKGMRKCGKSRCQIFNFVEEGSSFGDDRGLMYCINYGFDCDSAGVIYLLTCKRCSKIYVGSTVTSFRKRFNNHKSSLKRFGKGQRGIAGEHLYAHFYEEGHKGIENIQVKIIDRTDINDPKFREGFWTYKFDTFVPKGLNLRDFSL